MKITDTKLKGVKQIEPVVHQDHRGFFMESYNVRFLQECGINDNFIQDNHSMSREAGVIRGLHYQLSPKGQTKLIRVISGAIYALLLIFGWVPLPMDNGKALYYPQPITSSCSFRKGSHMGSVPLCRILKSSTRSTPTIRKSMIEALPGTIRILISIGL